jgi:hypothetical protein
LETVASVVERVEDEHGLNVELVVWRPVAGAEIVSAKKYDLAGLFE